LSLVRGFKLLRNRSGMVDLVKIYNDETYRFRTSGLVYSKHRFLEQDPISVKLVSLAGGHVVSQ